jgi:hypothetical protein
MESSGVFLRIRLLHCLTDVDVLATSDLYFMGNPPATSSINRRQHRLHVSRHKQYHHQQYLSLHRLYSPSSVFSIVDTSVLCGLISQHVLLGSLPDHPLAPISATLHCLPALPETFPARVSHHQPTRERPHISTLNPQTTTTATNSLIESRKYVLS